MISSYVNGVNEWCLPALFPVSDARRRIHEAGADMQQSAVVCMHMNVLQRHLRGLPMSQHETTHTFFQHYLVLSQGEMFQSSKKNVLHDFILA